jgi:hypothetical protein
MLETGVRTRMDIDHYDRVSQLALFRREPLFGRDELGFRKDIPFLRLLVVSKGGEVVGVGIVFHGTPPKFDWITKSNVGILPLWRSVFKENGRLTQIPKVDHC